MPTQLYKINQFTGRMVKDNPEGASPQDCADLLNVLPVNGILTMRRDYLCGDDVASVSVGTEVTAIGKWRTFRGHYVFPYTYGNGAVGLVGYIAGMDITNASLNVSTGIEYIAKDYELPSSNNAFMPYRNIVRVGGSATKLPAMIAYQPDLERFDLSISGFTIPEGFRIYSEYSDSPYQCVGLALPVVQSASPNTDYTVYLGYAANNVYAPSVEPELYFHVGDWVRYGISFVYDDTQETPVTMCNYSRQFTSGKDCVEVTIAVSETLYERITHVNLYRIIGTKDYVDSKNISPYDLQLIHSISIADGYDHTDYSPYTSTTQWYRHYLYHDCYLIKVYDFGALNFNNYADNSGYLDINYSGDTMRVSPNVYYNIGAIIKGRNVVNALSYYDNMSWVTCNRTLYLSEIGKPDLFIPGNKIVLAEREASSFTGIMELTSDYFIVCDPTNLYIINCADISPLNWYYSTKYELSILSPSSTYKTSDGLFIACRQGIYFISSNLELSNITQQMQQYWRDTILSKVDAGTITNFIIYYDDETGLLYVFGSDADSSFVIDFKSGSNTRVNTSQLPGGVNYLAFKGPSGLIYTLSEHPTTSNLLVFTRLESVSQEMDTLIRTIPLGINGAEALKFGKYLHINYGSSASVDVDVYLDHSVSPTTLGELPSNTAPTQYRLPMPYKFRQCEVEVKSVSNTGDFELHSIGLELKQGRPE